MTTPDRAETLADELASRRKRETPTRALGITEKKELSKLIDSDYTLLKADLKQYASELIRQRTLEVNAEFHDRAGEIETYRNEWNLLRDRFRTETEDFKNRARAAGLIAKASNGGYREQLLQSNAVDFEIPGKTQALEAVSSEVKHTMARAEHALEKKRMEAQRSLLMHGGMPPAAMALMASMPDPREVLMEAMQNAPNLLALTQARPVRQDEDVIEGLVIHDAENMADRHR